jgi:hypothetical protein
MRSGNVWGLGIGVLMSPKSAYCQRLAGILAVVLGLPVLGPAASAAVDRAQVEQLSVSEKLAALREATSAALNHACSGADGTDCEKLDEMRTAQWFSWASWASWASFASWGNFWRSF